MIRICSDHTHSPPRYVQIPSGEDHSKSSYIWNYFEKITKKCAICKICNKMVRANMSRHLKYKHPTSFTQWQRHILGKIQKSPEKDTPFEKTGKNRKRSSIWMYYDKVDDMAMCKICNITMKNNTFRHLRNKHPRAYRKLKRYQISKEENCLLLLDDPSNVTVPQKYWEHKYMKKYDNNQYRCELCQMILKMPNDDSSNMKRHIRVKHPYVYDTEVREFREELKKSSIVSNESAKAKVEYEYVVEYVDTGNIEENDGKDIALDPENDQSSDKDAHQSASETITEVQKNLQSVEVDNLDNNNETLERSSSLQDDDTDIEEKIKTICTDLEERESQDMDASFEPNVKNRKRSLAWIYYDKIGDMGMCKLCSVTMKNNKFRHLRNKHPGAYRKLKRLEKTRYERRLEKTKYEKFVTQDKPPHTKKRRRRAWVHKYQTKCGGEYYRCNLCQLVLKLPRGCDFGNMKRHIRIKHPHVYESEMRELTEEKERMKEEEELREQFEKNMISNNSAKDKEQYEYVVEYIDAGNLHQERKNINLDPENDASSDDDAFQEHIDASETIDDFNELQNAEVDEFNNEVETLETSDLLLDDDPYIEEKIKTICTKEVEGKKQKSKTCFWNFFTAITPDRLYKCMFCGRNVLVCLKSVNNLKRHIATKHPWQFDLIVKHAPVYDTCKQAKAKQEEVDRPDIMDSPITSLFDGVDDGCFKCHMCHKVVMSGNDYQLLYDHITEEHADRIIMYPA